jgi:DNA-binding MarR family transcriptional regulator
MRSADERYADMADRHDGSHLRDAQAAEDRRERAHRATTAQVSDGLHPMTKGWAKYHPTEATIEVIDMDGNRRYITPKQYQVLRAVQLLKDRATLTMIASSIGVATSTVSRGLLRLASLGLVAYDVTRGRYGGIDMLKTTSVDLKRRAQAAWERLKAYRMSAERRWYERLARSGYPFAFNVASYTVMDATLNWTAQDMAEVDAWEGS